MTDGGDPSTRTLALVQQSIDHLRELFETKMMEKDRAIDLLQHRADMQPTPDVINERLMALREHVETVAAGAKDSVNLALQGQKEAGYKAESAFNKQIDAVNAKVDDLKERVTELVSVAQGSRQSYGSIAVMVGLVSGFVTLLVNVLPKVIS